MEYTRIVALYEDCEVYETDLYENPEYALEELKESKVIYTSIETYIETL